MGPVSRLLHVSLGRQRPLTSARDLIAAGVRSVRRLPEQAGRLPLLGVEVALSVAGTVRREYRTVREEGWVAALARGRHDGGAQAVLGRRESPVGWPDASARSGEAGGVGEAPSEAAREVGAPGTARSIVEQVEAELADVVPDAATLDAEALPVPDYDHLTIGSLRARMRRLSLPELVTLREYERSHANRLQVVTMFDNRIAKLEAADGGDRD
jgi:hypothetical protein